MHIREETQNRVVFRVRDMPHYAPYLQFLVNIIQIHLAQVKAGGDDYEISGAFDEEDLKTLYHYLHQLEPGATVEIRERDARVLYASFVIVSRLLICDYGEDICRRVTKNLPEAHPWSHFETFRNTLLHHNAQMLMDMDRNMAHLIGGLDYTRQQLDKVNL